MLCMCCILIKQSYDFTHDFFFSSVVVWFSLSFTFLSRFGIFFNSIAHTCVYLHVILYHRTMTWDVSIQQYMRIQTNTCVYVPVYIVHRWTDVLTHKLSYTQLHAKINGSVTILLPLCVCVCMYVVLLSFSIASVERQTLFDLLHIHIYTLLSIVT